MMAELLNACIALGRWIIPIMKFLLSCPKTVALPAASLQRALNFSDFRQRHAQCFGSALVSVADPEPTFWLLADADPEPGPDPGF
jgi:hypothetical protein